MYMVQEIKAKWTLRMGLYAKIHYDYIMILPRIRTRSQKKQKTLKNVRWQRFDTKTP
jgi:hypothetical protein